MVVEANFNRCLKCQLRTAAVGVDLALLPDPGDRADFPETREGPRREEGRVVGHRLDDSHEVAYSEVVAGGAAVSHEQRAGEGIAGDSDEEEEQDGEEKHR